MDAAWFARQRSYFESCLPWRPMSSLKIDEVRRAHVLSVVINAISREGYTPYTLSLVKAAAKDLRSLSTGGRENLLDYFNELSRELKYKNWATFRKKWDK